MSTQGRLVEFARPVVLFVPKDITGSAQTSDWVSLKHARRLMILIVKGAWAGGTPAVTLEQATDASGTGAKALSFDKKYDYTALTDDVGAESTVSSNTFSLSATANEYHAIEVHASDLDLANGFAYVRVAVATPGSNADLLCIVGILYETGYSGKVSTLPSSLT